MIILLIKKPLLFIAVLCFALAGCNSAVEKQQDPVFEIQQNTGIDFINSVTGSRDFNILTYRNFYNGGGCAVGDLNNDGLADIYFSANQGSNKLYLNKSNFQFEDVTDAAGVTDSTNWSTGVVLVDINHDGWLDIYVCNAGYINGILPQSKLFINNAKPDKKGLVTFTEAAAAYGLDNKGGYATHAAFFDYDMDGDLDCFIINNSFIPTNTLNYENKRDLRAKDWPVKEFLKGGGDRFLRNDHGKFTDISEQAGIHGSLVSFGLGVTVGDVNGDGWLDVYVSNDFFERDYLYINQQNGTFKDELEKYVEHLSHSSMGADMCDINNDGYPDIFTTEMLPDDDYRLKTTSSFENIDVKRLKERSGFYHQYMQNTLQLNTGEGRFLETAYYSGVAASDWSWGGLIFDADNDALPDVFVCNGIYKDVTDQDFVDFFADELYQKMVMTGEKKEVDQIIEKMPSVPIPNKMFRNKGNIRFSDVAGEWGLGTPSFSNGAAYGDLDNDGDLDLVVNNVNQPCFIYKNKTNEKTKKHFIGIQLKGDSLNTFAIGSSVKIYTGKNILGRELIPSRGFQSSVDYKILIGLDAILKIDSLQIIWPNRTYSAFYNLTTDSVYHFSQPLHAPLYKFSSTVPVKKIFDSVKNNFGRHIEDDYIDFYSERNVPAMMSREGPAAAVADVNADGLQDVFICGAALQAGQLYIQAAGGTFAKKNMPAFETDANDEDVCSIFLDADKDGDMDLFVGSGGNNHPVNSAEYDNRLYINDGKGNFSKAVSAIPQNGMNTSCAAPCDFDNDGDMDIFVGARSVPNSYGETPKSCLLVNDGHGVFTDAAKTMYTNIANAGIITGAAWCNITNGKNKDLVISGEWMHPKIFSFNGTAFIEQKNNLQPMEGLWQSVKAGDLDNDGDDDLVLGNIGENFYMQPNEKTPIKIWINDFDNNGTKDKIITRVVNEKDVPMFTKKEITEQMPALKKQNFTHKQYATKSIHELFPKNIVEKSEVKIFNYSASCIAINEGNGKFTVKPMPWQVQLSCVNAIFIADINNDASKDILLGSNKYDFLPQFGRLDAAFGSVLINDGKTNFRWLGNGQSGINTTGCVRDIQELTINKTPYYLWLRNNDYPVLYKKIK